ncbi:MAG: hypothetical protein Q8K70_01065 [Bacteroidota bacterium]|nr:hypothetical protein [Bacteroidota bacterium]
MFLAVPYPTSLKNNTSLLRIGHIDLISTTKTLIFTQTIAKYDLTSSMYYFIFQFQYLESWMYNLSTEYKNFKYPISYCWIKDMVFNRNVC